MNSLDIVFPTTAGTASVLGATLTWLLSHHYRHIRRPEADAVKAIIALGDPHQMEQALQGVLLLVGQREEAQKQYLQGRILDVMEDAPDFFRHDGAGRELACSLLSTASRQDADEADLTIAYRQADLASDLWRKVGVLVEQAIVDSEKMASQMRRALRNPKSTLEDDRQVARQLLARLQNARTRQSGYGVQRNARKLYEMLEDAEHPTTLLNIILDEASHSLVDAD